MGVLVVEVLAHCLENIVGSVTFGHIFRVLDELGSLYWALNLKFFNVPVKQKGQKLTIHADADNKIFHADWHDKFYLHAEWHYKNERCMPNGITKINVFSDF